MNRREFIKAMGFGAAALSVGGYAALGDPGRRLGPSSVILSRADHVFIKGALAPIFAYPEGKIDYHALEGVLDGAMEALTGCHTPREQWETYVKSQDRVGIMVDVRERPVPMILVEAVIDRLVKSGVSQQAICVFDASEKDMFAAGYSLDNDLSGVAAYAADKSGFRGGTSRLVLDNCDAIINLARLRPDDDVGMAGALYNHLSVVPAQRRVELLANQAELPSAAAIPAVRAKLKLHLLDLLNPAYQAPPAPYTDYRWEYGGLLVSEDPVAVDVIGKQILEAKRALVRGGQWPLEPQPQYLEQAWSKYALGQYEPALINLVRVGYSAGALI